eukprot:scaffold29864_cov150-Skeletonema_dohrnii-CCMP3373.AAC.3
MSLWEPGVCNGIEEEKQRGREEGFKCGEGEGCECGLIQKLAVRVVQEQEEAAKVDTLRRTHSAARQRWLHWHERYSSGTCVTSRALLEDALGGSLPLHIACKHCDPSIVKYLANLDKWSIRVTDSHGNTPLHCACLAAAANYDVIELLLAHYPTVPVGERNSDEELPIRLLLEHSDQENSGYMSSMFLLLRANPDVDGGWMI